MVSARAVGWPARAPAGRFGGGIIAVAAVQKSPALVEHLRSSFVCSELAVVGDRAERLTIPIVGDRAAATVSDKHPPRETCLWLIRCRESRSGRDAPMSSGSSPLLTSGCPRGHDSTPERGMARCRSRQWWSPAGSWVGHQLGDDRARPTAPRSGSPASSTALPIARSSWLRSSSRPSPSSPSSSTPPSGPHPTTSSRASTPWCGPCSARPCAGRPCSAWCARSAASPASRRNAP